MAHASTLQLLESDSEPLHSAREISGSTRQSLSSSPRELALFLLGGTLLAAAGGFWAGAPRANSGSKSSLGYIAPSRGLAIDDGNGCHTAAPGDQCFERIQFAIREHHDDHPDWYHGLTKQSSLEEFQNYLHKEQPDAECPVPCNLEAAKKNTLVKLGFSATCHTTTAGEPCYSRIQYTLRHIANHPKRYKDLSKDSTFAQVQRYLYKHAPDGELICPSPCGAMSTHGDTYSEAGKTAKDTSLDAGVSVRSFTVEDGEESANATSASRTHFVVA